MLFTYRMQEHDKKLFVEQQNKSQYYNIRLHLYLAVAKATIVPDGNLLLLVFFFSKVILFSFMELYFSLSLHSSMF